MTALGLYRTMVTIREFEMAAARLLAQNKLPGFLHLSIGQEAVAAGVCSQLRSDDYIATTHRGHGHCIAKGGELNRMMSELFGHIDGYCKGRSGSMHIADAEQGILGANGIVGGGLPLAVGAGWSAKVRGTDQVTVAFFGEGAVAEGTFHESMNLAALWKLPVLFVCENNQYAQMSHVSGHLAVAQVSQICASYGILGQEVDGNDVLAVQAAAAAAVERARRGEGPTLLECKTYRWHGHFEGDPQSYRTRAEQEEWKGRDPLPRWRLKLLESGLANEAAAVAIEQEAKAAVAAAVEFGDASAVPSATALLEDVYARTGGSQPGATKE